jgi:hypothetical protein
MQARYLQDDTAGAGVWLSGLSVANAIQLAHQGPPPPPALARQQCTAGLLPLTVRQSSCQ